MIIVVVILRTFKNYLELYFPLAFFLRLIVTSSTPTRVHLHLFSTVIPVIRRILAISFPREMDSPMILWDFFILFSLNVHVRAHTVCLCDGPVFLIRTFGVGRGVGVLSNQTRAETRTRTELPSSTTAAGGGGGRLSQSFINGDCVLLPVTASAPDTTRNFGPPAAVN